MGFPTWGHAATIPIDSIAQAQAATFWGVEMVETAQLVSEQG